jgi:hypothetical protein
MFCGVLNLSTESGREPVLTFRKYGEIKSLLYSTLIQVVNYNKSFADEGYFYIMDKDAVYYLGLTEAYEKLLNKDMMDGICSFNDNLFGEMLDNVTDIQKQTIIKLVSEKICNGEQVDYNKLEILNKKFNTDIKKVSEEMKSVDELLHK